MDKPQPAPQPSGPTRAADRIELIDAVRGFALYGVLLANLIWVSQEVALAPAQVDAMPTAAIDKVVRYGVQFFIDWKFYTLFSFLFGLGFSVQLLRGERRGAAIVPLYMRRLGVLLGIGLVHGYLFWYGDVLHLYALLGFLLILFRGRSDRVLLGAGIGLAVVLPAVVVIAQTLADPKPPSPGPDAEELKEIAARFQAFNSSDYVAILKENAKHAVGLWTSGFAVHFLPSILGKFLLGFYVGRRRLLEEPEAHLPLFRRLLVWGLVFGMVGNAIWVWAYSVTHSGAVSRSSPWILASELPVYFGLVAMAAFYLSALVLLWRNPSWRRRLSYLAPVGRMALTNYLTHSLVYLVLFYGFGVGLLGRVGATRCLAISLAVFAAQIVFSHWWLRRFRFGPAEWLWRSLTYGARQPMSLATAPLAQ
jgi:uncharacterized protein